MGLADATEIISRSVRALVVIAFSFTAVIGLTHWATRKGHLSPFSGWPRLVRRISDPVLRPFERRVVRAGGNPQDAPLWLLGATVVGGLILIGFTDWLMGFLADTVFAVSSSQGNGLAFLVATIFRLLNAALWIRVIASWFVSPHARWLRPVRLLTDWILLPIQRVLPSFGPIDVSPIVAILLLGFLQNTILRALYN